MLLVNLIVRIEFYAFNITTKSSHRVLSHRFEYDIILLQLPLCLEYYVRHHRYGWPPAITKSGLGFEPKPKRARRISRLITTRCFCSCSNVINLVPALSW